MLKLVTFITVIFFGLVLIPCTYAEKSTELYIPVGKSPGLSAKYTATGRIDTVDPSTQTLTMSDSSSSYTVKLTKRTKIYLDKSKLKMTNTYGTFEDCRKDRMVEVRFEDDVRGRPAEWIKILIDK